VEDFEVYLWDTLCVDAFLENYIKKFGNSTIAYKGERHSFESIILSKPSPVFEARLEIFKARLKELELTGLSRVSKYWPQYEGYINFVKTFIER